MLLPVLSPAQSNEWDKRAERAGILLATLMDAAGRAACHVAATRFPERIRAGALVACGAGNNGGDGWVVARALHRLEIPVFVVPGGGNPSALNQVVAGQARAEGVRVVEPEGPWPTVGLVIDALLGTGARGALRPNIATLVDRLADLAVPVVAIDGPTGVDLDTGVTHRPALTAALTVTFGGLRRGHLLAREECGDIVVVDIGHPPADAAWPRLVTDLDAAGWLRPLNARDHKGSRGRVVVVGGDTGMSGALRLAARAAFAAGAGLVHAMAPEGTIAALTAAEPDLQTAVLPFGAAPSPNHVDLIARADVLVIGPGLGRGAGRRELILALAASAQRIVLDADGLNAFQGEAASLAALARGRSLVLTPHPTEFRRLFPAEAEGLELDPWAAAASAAASAGATVLLKGVPSVISEPGLAPLTIAAGNPGLATGGSGDILSGILGTMLAQGLEPGIAAATAAQILGRAADLGARRVTARGLRPMDVVAAFPDLWRAWAGLRAIGAARRPPLLTELDRPQTL
jgi:ADP-dependent NAD(P)H-hydrate dehydratase / NAD(P)H-hydrate epimerase